MNEFYDDIAINGYDDPFTMSDVEDNLIMDEITSVTLPDFNTLLKNFSNSSLDEIYLIIEAVRRPLKNQITNYI